MREGLGIVERVELGIGRRVRLSSEKYDGQSIQSSSSCSVERPRGVEKKRRERVTVEGTHVLQNVLGVLGHVRNLAVEVVHLVVLELRVNAKGRDVRPSQSLRERGGCGN